MYKQFLLKNNLKKSILDPIPLSDVPQKVVVHKERHSKLENVKTSNELYFESLSNRLSFDAGQKKLEVISQKTTRQEKKAQSSIKIEPFAFINSDFPPLPVSFWIGEFHYMYSESQIIATLPECKCKHHYDKCIYTPNFVAQLIRFVYDNKLALGKEVRQHFLTNGCITYRDLFTFVCVVPQGNLIPKVQHDPIEHIFSDDAKNFITEKLGNIEVDLKLPLLDAISGFFGNLKSKICMKSTAAFMTGLACFVMASRVKMSKRSAIFFYGSVAFINIYCFYEMLTPEMVQINLKWLTNFVIPQSFDDIFNLTVEGISGLLFCTTVRFDSVSSFGANFKKMTEYSSSFSKGIEAFKEWFLKIVVGIAEAVGTDLSHWLNAHEAQFRKLQLTCHRLLKEFEAGQYRVTQTLRVEFTHTMIAIDTLDISIPNNSKFGVLKGSLRNLKSITKDLASAVQTISAAGYRDKPFLVGLVGGSGVGKTTILSDHNNLLMNYYLSKNQREDYKANPATYIYTKAPAKHWDGSTNTIALSIPDFLAGKLKEGSGEMDEAQIMLMALGTNACPVPMADCSLKKNNYLSPSFITYATNQKVLTDELLVSMNNPEAIRRRLNDNAWWVEVKPEFAKAGQLDYEKYSKAKKLSKTGIVDAFWFRTHCFDKIAEPRQGVDRFSYIQWLNIQHKLVVEHIRINILARESNTAGMDHFREALPVGIEELADFVYEVEPQSDFDSMVFEKVRGFSKQRAKIQSILNLDADDVSDLTSMLTANDQTLNFTGHDLGDDDADSCNLLSDIDPVTLEEHLVGVITTCDEVDAKQIIREIKEYVENCKDGNRPVVLPTYPIRKKNLYTVLESITLNGIQDMADLDLDDGCWQYILSHWDFAMNYLSNVYSKSLAYSMNILESMVRAVDKPIQWFYNYTIFGTPLYKLVGAVTLGVTAGLAVYNLSYNLIKWACGLVVDDEPEVDVQMDVSMKEIFQPDLSSDHLKFFESRSENSYYISAKLEYHNGLINTVTGNTFNFLCETTGETVGHFIGDLKDYLNDPCIKRVRIGLKPYYKLGDFDWFNFTLEADSDVRIVSIPEDNYLFTQDIVILKFPESVLNKSNIIKYMPSRSDTVARYLNDTSFEGRLIMSSPIKDLAKPGELSRLGIPLKPNDCKDCGFDRDDTTKRECIKCDTHKLRKNREKFPRAYFKHIPTHIKYCDLPSTYTCSCCGKPRSMSDRGLSYTASTYQIDIKTASGDCGTLGYTTDKAFFKFGTPVSKHPMLVYLHVAGSSDKGFGIRLFRDDFEFLKPKRDSKSFAERHEENLNVINEFLHKEGIPVYKENVTHNSDITTTTFKQIRPLATMPVFNISGKSQLEKTPAMKINEYKKFFKVVTENMKPATLHPDYRTIEGKKVLIDPYKQGLLPYGTNNINISVKRLEAIFDVVAGRELQSFKIDVEPCNLTFVETIAGIPELINSLNRSSSLGTTLNDVTKHIRQYRPDIGVGRKGMFGDSEFLFDTIGARLFKHCFDHWDLQLRKGYRMHNIVSPSLKDEMVSFLKHEALKTRIFFTADLLYLALARRYSGAFALAITENRDYASCQVGINAYTDFTNLYNRCVVAGPKGFFLDWGKFDKFMLIICLYVYKKQEEKFYGLSDPEGNLARDMLFEDAKEPIMKMIVTEGMTVEAIFAAFTNLTVSGYFITSVVNSCASKGMITFCMVVNLLANKYNKTDFESVPIYEIVKVTNEVLDNTLILVYGDDSITVPSVKYSKYYNLKGLSKAAMMLGSTLTDESDFSDEDGYTFIKNGVFLGREFILSLINGKLEVDASLRLSSIMKPLMYSHGAFNRDIEIAKYESAMHELSLDKKKFDKFSPVLIEICKRVYKHDLTVTSYDLNYVAIKSKEFASYDRFSLRRLDKKKLSHLRGYSSGLTESDVLKPVSEIKNLDMNSPSKSEGLSNVCLNNIVVHAYVDPESDKTVSKLPDQTVTTDTDSAWCESEGVTCFTETGGSISLDISDASLPSAMVSEDLSIGTFMARPTIWSQVSPATTDAAGFNLYHIDINTVLQSPLYKDKMSGYECVSGTAIIRLEISASKHHQGMFMLRQIPNVFDRSLVEPGYLNRIDVYPHGLVQQPGVIFNLENTVVTMRFPYIGCTPMTKTNYVTAGNADATKCNSWGRVSLDTMVPLAIGAGGSTNITITTFISFEDIKLAIPVVPQTDMDFIMCKQGNSTFELIHEIPDVYDHVFPQSNKMKVKFGKSNSEKEADSYKISTGLLTVAKASDVLGTIPIVSGIFDTVSWGARFAGNLFSAFGLSKSRTDSLSVVARNGMAYSHNAEGTTTSVGLGVLYDGKIMGTPEFSYNSHDEMSFPFLNSVENYVTRFDFSNSNAIGDVLSTISINPIVYYQTLTSTYNGKVLTARMGGPMFYGGQIFTKWTGSVNLKIRFSKTPLHKGELQVNLLAADVPAATTTVNSAYLMRTMVDIGEQDEIVINIPYLKAKAWLDVASYDGNVGDISADVQIKVLNTLRNPTTVSSSITCFVTMFPGPDFEFAVPSTSNRVITPVIPQSDMEFYTLVTPQSSSLATKVIGDGVALKTNIGKSAYTMSEKIVSIRQLTNRAMSVVRTTASTTNEMYYPFYFSGATIDTTSGALLIPNAYGDLISYYAGCFGFYRGGMRVGFYGLSMESIYNITDYRYKQSLIGAVDNPIIAADVLNNKYGTAVLPTASGARQVAGAVTVHEPTTAMEYLIPYQSATPASLVHLGTGKAFAVAATFQSLGGIGMSSSGNSKQITRSTGEDFNFSYFICCPPVLWTYA